MIEIKVNCKGSHDFKLSELFILQDTKDFQLKELNKNNFEKLKNGIIKKGFWFPFFVWHCEEEDKWYYTDGTQRHKVLNKMAESGQYKMPEKFPCVEIFAKDKKEAAEAILTQSSSYGKFTEEGLYGFIHEYDLVSDFAEIKGGLELPDFDLDGFESGWMDDKPGEGGNEDHSTLFDRFIVPPFSILDARQGYWQDRKRAWLSLGIQSELGRGGGLTLGDSPQVTEKGLNYYRERERVASSKNQDKLNAFRKKISPGGSPRPACNYKNKERGRGDGRPI